MKLFKNVVVAMLVLFGLGMSVDAQAQTNWVERYAAVDALGQEWLDLPDSNFDENEKATLQRVYRELMQDIDDAEDTQEGYEAFEVKLDNEADLNGWTNDYAGEIQQVKDHLLSIITE